MSLLISVTHWSYPCYSLSLASLNLSYISTTLSLLICLRFDVPPLSSTSHRPDSQQRPMTAATIELAKRRYSAELAAYTHTQWRMACAALEAAQNSRVSTLHVDDGEDEGIDRDPRLRRSQSDSTTESDASDSIVHPHDYAESDNVARPNGH